MKATRRGFFGILGGAAVGGKKAIAVAATTLTSELESLDPTGRGRLYGSGVHSDGDWDDTPNPIKITDPSVLRTIGIPDWLRHEWQENEDKYPVFDPDVASMRSMSLSAKIILQKDRNLAKLEDEFLARGLRKQEAKLWRKLYGQIGWW